MAGKQDEKTTKEYKDLVKQNDSAVEEFLRNGGKIEIIPPVEHEDKRPIRSMSAPQYVNTDLIDSIDNKLSQVDDNREKINEYFTRLVNNKSYPQITKENVEQAKAEFIQSVLEGTASFMSLSDADNMFGEKRKINKKAKPKKLPEVDFSVLPADLLAELGIKGV